MRDRLVVCVFMESGLLPRLGAGGKWLLVVAAPVEGRAVLQGVGIERGGNPPVRWQATSIGNRLDLVVTGVGKANAAAGLARVFNPVAHRGVLSVGLGGVLPGGGVTTGDVVLASVSIYADEGLISPDGFLNIADMGFAPSQDGPGIAAVGIAGTSWAVEALTPCARTVGPVATVSTCAGTDDQARSIVERTSAVVEAMEGAAVGFTTQRLGGGEVAFAELRVVSNSTGDRERQTWDLTEGLSRLRDLVALL